MGALLGRYRPGKPLVVAEIGPNHNGDYKLARCLVQAAHDAGADAVKFQCYTPEEMVAPTTNPTITWRGQPVGLRDLYTKAQTPREWLPLLFTQARDLGLEPFTSVFSTEGADWVRAHCKPRLWKVASGEGGWVGLREHLAGYGDTVLVSDGVVDAPWPVWHHEVWLTCVASYPASIHDYGMWGQDRSTYWGVSDHTLTGAASMVGATMGASVLEAHLQLEYTDTVDGDHSWTPEQFSTRMTMARGMAKAARRSRRPQPHYTQWRRRWHWTRDLAQGTTVEPDMVYPYRNTTGVDVQIPIVGHRLNRDVRVNQPTAYMDIDMVVTP